MRQIVEILNSKTEKNLVKIYAVPVRKFAIATGMDDDCDFKMTGHRSYSH